LDGHGVDLAALAFRQQEDSKILKQKIERCAEMPEEVVELHNFGSGATDLPGLRRAVVIVQPNGRMTRLSLTMQNARQLGRELLAPHPEESDNGKEVPRGDQGDGGAGNR
jgi:hypothetical protein